MRSIPEVALITPAVAAANNGNWQTAARWAALLRGHYRVGVAQAWQGGDEALMLALHARRSASSVLAWKKRWPQRPLVVVLTGTDLYRDISVDASAQRSLELADRLLVLNELGAQALPEAYRAKTQVCLQSSRRWRPRTKTSRHVRVLMVGHLRDEKAPRTFFEAARLLAHRPDIHFDHIGAGLDTALAAEAAALAQALPNYRWLGARPHDETRRRIAAAHVLVHASVMEGGAHVVIEAMQSGTAVIASRIDGNLGLLGADHPATFATHDAVALAALIEQARDDENMLATLVARQSQRADLFEPARERATLLNVLRNCELPSDPRPRTTP